MSKCQSCNQELNFPKTVLKQLTTCPFCNAPLKVADAGNPEPITIEMALANLVSDYGAEIFSRENEGKLRKELVNFPTDLSKESKIIQMMMVENIPAKLFAKRESSKIEKQEVLSVAQKNLSEDFYIPVDNAKTMILLVANALDFGTEFPEEKPKEDDTQFVDPRDGEVYKTVKIGNQVWMAENLRFQTDDECCLLDDDFTLFAKYGYLYTYQAAQKACPEGWHIPCQREFEQLLKFISKDSGGGDARTLLSSKEWKGTDDYGFNALPGGKCCRDVWSERKNFYNEKANFWTSSDAAIDTDKTTFVISIYGVSFDSACLKRQSMIGMTDVLSVFSGNSLPKKERISGDYLSVRLIKD